MFEIKPAQQVAVSFHAIGIVDVGRLQETQPIADRGFEDVRQAALRESMQTNEANFLYTGLVAFFDLENQIDAIVR